MKKVLIVLFVIVSINIFAQQTTILSQYYYNGFVLNPAMTGSDDANYMTATFRKQWLPVKGGPITGSLAYNRFLEEKNMGFGGYAMFDKVGYISRSTFKGSYAYHINLGDYYDKRRFSIGLNGGLTMLRYNGAEALLDQPNDPVVILNAKTGIYPDFALGGLYYTQNFFVGGSVNQAIPFTNSFKDIVDNNTKIRNQMHIYLMGGGTINLDDERDYQLEPKLWFRYVYGAPWNLNATARLRMFDLFWVGVGYETSKQIMFDVGVDVDRSFQLGYAFSRHINYLGPLLGSTHELSLSYIFGGTRDAYYRD